MSGVTSSIRIGPRMVRSACADFAVRCSRTSWRLLSLSLIHSTGGVRKTLSRLRRNPVHLGREGFDPPLRLDYRFRERLTAAPFAAKSTKFAIRRYSAESSASFSFRMSGTSARSFAISCSTR
jgi:hypothetical protein